MKVRIVKGWWRLTGHVYYLLQIENEERDIIFLSRNGKFECKNADGNAKRFTTLHKLVCYAREQRFRIETIWYY